MMAAIAMKLIWFLFIMAVVICIVAMVFLLISTFGNDDKGWHRCYRCKKCGAVYDPDGVPYICKYCGAEITEDHDIFTIRHQHNTADLKYDRDITDDCEIVIARKVGRRWEIMKKEPEK